METETSSINIASMKRIMLKLSGEVLVGNQKYGLDPEKLISIASDIIRSHGGEIELNKSEIGGLKVKISLPT